MLDSLRDDVRFALRSLRKNAGFTTLAIVALALGIGATVSIFGVLDAVLLRPLPYAHADRLVTILEGGDKPVAPGNFLDWRREAKTIAAMGAAEAFTPDLAGGVGAPESARGLRLSHDVLPLLGVRPLLGRVFAEEEEETGKDGVVVLSYELFMRRFGGDSAAIGREISLNGRPVTVIGVMPKGFAFAPFWVKDAQLFAPLALGERRTSRRFQSLRVFARLADGATLSAARAEIGALTARLEKEFPGTNRNIQVVALTEKVVGNVRPALLVMMGAVGFVLLTACANVAHMLLARGAARRRELAVRSALGASRGRVVRQLLTESVLLALAGGAAGMLVASAGLRLLVAARPAELPRVDQVALDARVLGFALLVSLGSALLFGLAPALRASEGGIAGALKEGERGSTEGLRRNPLRSALVASELGLALVLLVGAGLLGRTFAALQAVAPGFEPKNVLTAVVSVAGSAQKEPARREVFFDQLLSRVRALPGVVSAGAINHLPLAGDTWGFPFAIEGQAPPAPGEGPNAVFRAVLPGAIESLGIHLVAGRGIDDHDVASAPKVAVVSRRFAARYFPGVDPLGKRITFDDPAKSPEWTTIVGLADDVRQETWAAEPRPEIWIAWRQSRLYLEETSPAFTYLTLVVKTSSAPEALAGSVQNAALALDRSVVVSKVQSMDAVVRGATGASRFYLVLLAAFAGTALVLAAVGVYGVMSHSVARRRHELGIRMALGARPAELVRLVVSQAMTLAGVGAAAGLLAALLLTRFLSRLLYGVTATDPVVFVAVPLFLGLVALLASALPARRAARVDPAVALRAE